jgi:hypothetical protein
MIPKNRKYPTRIEVITNTVAAPIILLSFCFIAIFVFTPLLSPDMATVFGIEKKVLLTVEWVEFKGPSIPMPAQYGGAGSPDCTYWKAYGSYQGRKLVAQSCYSLKKDTKLTNIAQVGEKLDVIVAPYGNNTRFVGESYSPYGTRVGEKVAVGLIFFFVPYGIFISFRMLYIGYSSNWEWSSKKRS